MIIVEGADNCGKTTLIDQLLAIDPRLRLIRRKRFKPGKNETIASSYMGALIPPDGDRERHGYGIVDRLLASEVIYGDLLRGGSRITPRDHLDILNALIGYQALVIHCDIPDDRILETWKSREQLYPDHALPIAQAYRQRIRSIFPGIPVLTYDWTHPQAEQHRLRIVDLHQMIQGRLAENRPDLQIRKEAMKLGLRVDG
jgi:hypothetical protein